MRLLRPFVVLLFLSTIWIKHCCPQEYVAFSLNAAKEQILSVHGDKNHREIFPEVFQLGGMSTVKGFVYDRTTGDLILVGEKVMSKPPVTLDDVAVALKARYKYKEWPQVGIYQGPKSRKPRKSSIRFSGGIENTQFGNDLVFAHKMLIQLAEGRISSGVEGVRSYGDLFREESHLGRTHEIINGYWFSMVVPTTSFRDDVVAIRGLNIRVSTRVLSAKLDGREVGDISHLEDTAAKRFAESVSDNFENLAEVHPVFFRLCRLYELVLLSNRIEALVPKPDLSFWIENYPVAEVRTPLEIEQLEGSSEYDYPEEEIGYRDFEESRVSVSLLEASRRFRNGDITALNDLVRETRTSPKSVSWCFRLEDERILTSGKITIGPTGIAYKRLEPQFEGEPTPEKLQAFSLRVAESMMNRLAEGSDYRTTCPEIYYLGGINRLEGLIYDKEDDDIIILGRYDSELEPLTMDDFVVALRSRFIYHEWPMVRYDRLSDRKGTGKHLVAYAGGIEGTQFGSHLYNANERLAQIALGLVRLNVSSLQSYWDLTVKNSNDRVAKMDDKTLRYMFYPSGAVAVIGDGFAVLDELGMGIFSDFLIDDIEEQETIGQTPRGDKESRQFESAFAADYKAICREEPAFRRLIGLGELVALSRAIEELQLEAEIHYWLEVYHVKKVTTRDGTGLSGRAEAYKDSESGEMIEVSIGLSGGIRLLPVALQVDGSAVKLEDDILIERPNRDALCWGIDSQDRFMLSSPGMVEMGGLEKLHAQAMHFQELGLYQEAINLYGKILEYRTDWALPFNNRGVAFASLNRCDEAVSDYSEAIKLLPMYEEAYFNRGVAYDATGEYDLAVKDYSQVLELDPEFLEAYNNRGLVYYQQGKYELAIADYTLAISANPEYAKAYNNRGVAYCESEQQEQALSDLTKAVSLDPHYATAYGNRGVVYSSTHKAELGESDYTKAISIEPGFLEAYFNRGVLFEEEEQYDQAILDYAKAIQLAPGCVECYLRRGNVLGRLDEHEKAILDYSEVIKLDPLLAEAHYLRGNSYKDLGQEYYDKAARDYSSALGIDPEYAGAYHNLGMIFYELGQYDRAILDYDKAIEIIPTYKSAYYNKALACDEAKRKNEAVDAYRHFIRYASSQDREQIEHARKRISKLMK